MSSIIPELEENPESEEFEGDPEFQEIQELFAERKKKKTFREFRAEQKARKERNRLTNRISLY